MTTSIDVGSKDFSMNKITVTLADVENHSKQIKYTITPHDNALGKDWISKFESDIIDRQLNLRQNYCFMGFPNTYRDFDYLCGILNDSIERINGYNDIWIAAGLAPYIITERYAMDRVVDPETLMEKQENLNFLHNHFEVLRGTVWDPSPYTVASTPEMILDIENLNFCCHEFESLIIAQRNYKNNRKWVRPSNIFTFHDMHVFDLTDDHRKLFLENAFDRKFGGVYMHWGQIGKRFDEVYRDENAPDLIIGEDPTDIRTAGTQCEAITALRYYCGGFDIDWGLDWNRNNSTWQQEFFAWIEKNGLDPNDTSLSLGFLPIGQVDILESFGTEDPEEVWEIISKHMYVYSFECNGKTVVYP